MFIYIHTKQRHGLVSYPQYTPPITPIATCCPHLSFGNPLPDRTYVLTNQTKSLWFAKSGRKFHRAGKTFESAKGCGWQKICLMFDDQSR